LVSKRSQTHRWDWVLTTKCQRSVKTLDCQNPVPDWIFASRIDQRRLHDLMNTLSVDLVNQQNFAT
jgi:hypothetical protein